MRERPQFRYVCRVSVRAAGRSWQGQLAGGRCDSGEKRRSRTVCNRSLRNRRFVTDMNECESRKGLQEFLRGDYGHICVV